MNMLEEIFNSLYKPFDPRRVKSARVRENAIRELLNVGAGSEPAPTLRGALAYFTDPSKDYHPEVIYDPLAPGRTFLKYPENDPYEEPSAMDIVESYTNPESVKSKLTRQALLNQARKEAIKPKNNPWGGGYNPVLSSLLRQYDHVMSTSPGLKKHQQRGGKNIMSPMLAISIMGHESNFCPEALGSSGDAGLFQLIPQTQDELKQYGIEYDNVGASSGMRFPKKLFPEKPSVYDPDANIRGGLKWLLRKWFEERPDYFKDAKTVKDAQLKLLELYNVLGDRGKEYTRKAFSKMQKAYNLPFNYTGGSYP